MIFPIILLAAGATTLIILATTGGDGPVPDHPPDLPPTPGSTRYKLVDAILPELKKASDASGIPLGLNVGWIAKESGGRLGEVTKLDERGYYQLIPDESKKLGIDHQRLSTDPVYSINGGLLLIGSYMKAVDALGVASKGSSYYWTLVKLAHTMGRGAMDKIVAAAKSAGAAGSWSDLENYALSHNAELLSSTKHAPAKWFPFIDQVRDVGMPFGFGSADVVVGGEVFSDIVDPLDCLKS